MKRAKPKFRVGQVVVRKTENNCIGRIVEATAHRPIEYWLSYGGGWIQEGSLRPLTKRERGG